MEKKNLKKLWQKDLNIILNIPNSGPFSFLFFSEGPSFNFSSKDDIWRLRVSSGIGKSPSTENKNHCKIINDN